MKDEDQYLSYNRHANVSDPRIFHGIIVFCTNNAVQNMTVPWKVPGPAVLIIMLIKARQSSWPWQALMNMAYYLPVVSHCLAKISIG